MIFTLKLVLAFPLVSGICGCLLALLLGSDSAPEQQAIGDAYDRRDREIDEWLTVMGPAPKEDQQ